MFVFFRQNQRVLMLVIAILTIIAFIWLYNQTNSTPLNSDQVGKIYGRTLRTVDVDRLARSYRVALMLGQVDLITTLGGRAQDEGESVTSYIWNVMVLRHEAARLGIVPTDRQVEEAIKSIPALQTDGAFDPDKYRQFLAERLVPLGFTAHDMEEIIRDSLRLESLRGVVSSTASTSPVERDFLLRAFQGVNAGVIRFNLDEYLARTQIPEEDIVKFHEENQAHLVTDETRSVHFAKFPLSEAEAALQGRARVDALQVKANTASDFATKLEAGNVSFDETAREAGAVIGETLEFSATGVPVSGSPEDYPDLPQLAESVFHLSEKSPFSGVLQVGDGFYVVRLSKVTPSRPLTLEEARPQITQRLKDEAAQKAMDAAAADARAKIVEAMSSGKTFSDAAQGLGLSVEALANVVPESAGANPEQRGLAAATILLNEGQLSGFEPAPWGGFLIHLEKREPLDQASLGERLAQVDTMMLDQRRTLIFAEWLRSAREAADVRVLNR